MTHIQGATHYSPLQLTYVPELALTNRLKALHYEYFTSTEQRDCSNHNAYKHPHDLKLSDCRYIAHASILTRALMAVLDTCDCLGRIQVIEGETAQGCLNNFTFDQLPENSNHVNLILGV